MRRDPNGLNNQLLALQTLLCAARAVNACALAAAPAGYGSSTTSWRSLILFSSWADKLMKAGEMVEVCNRTDSHCQTCSPYMRNTTRCMINGLDAGVTVVVSDPYRLSPFSLGSHTCRRSALHDVQGVSSLVAARADSLMARIMLSASSYLTLQYRSGADWHYHPGGWACYGRKTIAAALRRAALLPQHHNGRQHRDRMELHAAAQTSRGHQSESLRTGNTSAMPFMVYVLTNSPHAPRGMHPPATPPHIATLVEIAIASRAHTAVLNPLSSFRHLVSRLMLLRNPRAQARRSHLPLTNAAPILDPVSYASKAAIVDGEADHTPNPRVIFVASRDRREVQRAGGTDDNCGCTSDDEPTRTMPWAYARRPFNQPPEPCRASLRAVRRGVPPPVDENLPPAAPAERYGEWAAAFVRCLELPMMPCVGLPPKRRT